MAKKILFQGDSITDAIRSRDNEHYAGHGYATMVKGILGLDYPEQYECVNRGVSGNRIVDVYARIKADIINLQPDYMSILIGINDVWHEFGSGNGVDAVKFEKIYGMLIEELQEALPNLKIMILEPFVLKASATASDARYHELYPMFREETEKRAAASRRIAEKYDLPFVELMHLFDARYNPEQPGYWLYDGVHPSAAGHMLIAREWVKTFETIK